ncbi:ATP-binding cassette domain-containing protein [candidate division KSB1 bacterium]|nr:ATP-binding cassette domain-containing protein [candidate division KSB1 bacterium]
MIAVHDLIFEYKTDGIKIRVLDGLSFNIGGDEWVALMGANGSGKTTLSLLLKGLLTPLSGRIFINGNLVDPSREPEGSLGLVFQNPDHQFVAPTVEQEIAFGLENRGVEPVKLREKVEQHLSAYQLLDHRHRSPSQLSGGEKRRLSLASVLVMEPTGLIFDEPTTLLDPQDRDDFLKFMLSMKGKMAILFITPYPDEALIADRLLILHRGKIAYDDQPSKVFNHSTQLKEWGIGVPSG